MFGLRNIDSIHKVVERSCKLSYIKSFLSTPPRNMLQDRYDEIREEWRSKHGNDT
jgi:hypothetical protein